MAMNLPALTQQFTARLVWSPNPMMPAANRTITPVHFTFGTSLAAVLHEHCPHIVTGPCLVRVNNQWMKRDDWPWYPLAEGDVIHCIAAADGGEDSDPVRIILQIAVAVVAFYVPSTWGMWTAVARGAVLIGGSYLVNAIRPARMPDLSNEQIDQGSPTYQVQPTRNRMRPYEPMQLVYGHHRVVPDHGSRPYTEYDGEDQVLFQIFDFGITPHIQLSEFVFGDTPLEDFDINIERDTEISGDDGKLSLFPVNVNTEAGGALTASAGWLTRTTSPDTRRIGVDIVGSLYQINKKGTGSQDCAFEIEYRVAGSADPWTPMVRSTTTVTRSHYWSRGYWKAGTTDDWVQIGYDEPDDSGLHTDGEVLYTMEFGNPRSGYQTVSVIWRWRPYGEARPWTGSKGGVRYYRDAAPPQEYKVRVSQLILTNNNTKPIRKTIKQKVPLGQYEVRVRRLTSEFTGDKRVANFEWSQLKSYQPDNGEYEGRTRMAIEIVASGQLEGPIDELAAVAHAAVEVRDPDGVWHRRYTSNPAWIFLHHARGKVDATGRRLYGALLPDSRIEIEALADWADFCTDNGLECNIVFDGTETVYEQLEIIAQCGRAAITWGTGRLGVVIDEPKPATAVFTMADIIAGSFRVSYHTRALPDTIEGHYINSEIGWKPDVVRVTVPGATTKDRPVAVDLKGITKPVQAAEETNLLAAAQVYHRKTITWETDAAGLVNLRGDTVILSHDLTRWGKSGRLLQADDTTSLVLSREVPFTGELDRQWILIVQPDGTQSHHEVKGQAVGNSDAITLIDPLPSVPGANAIDWRFAYAPEETPGREVTITGIRPMNENRVRLSAVEHLTEYHAAKSGTFEEPGSASGPPDAQVGEIKFDEQVLSSDGTTRVFVSFDIVYTTHAAVRYKMGDSPFVEIPISNARGFTVDMEQEKTLTVEVKPMLNRISGAIKAGPKATSSHTVYGIGPNPPPVTDFAASRQGATDRVRLSWSPILATDYPYVAYYEIRKGATWNDSVTVGQTNDNQHELLAAQPGTYHVAAINTRGAESVDRPTVIIDTTADINIIVQREEAPTWAGTITNGTVVSGRIEQTDNAADTVYEAPVIDIGKILTSRIEMESQLERVTLADAWANWTQPWGFYGDGWAWGGPIDVVEQEIEIATSLDNVTYTAWRPYIPSYAKFRYLKTRITIRSLDPAQFEARLASLNQIIDVPDRKESYEDLIIPVGGKTITYNEAFEIPPVVTLTIQDGAAGDTYRVTSKTVTSMFVEVFNSTDTSVERSCDITVEAY